MILDIYNFLKSTTGHLLAYFIPFINNFINGYIIDDIYSLLMNNSKTDFSQPVNPKVLLINGL